VALGETGKQVSALGATLKTAAGSVRATSATVGGVVGQVGTSLDATARDLGTLGASLTKAASDVRTARASVTGVVGQVTTALNNTAASLSTLRSSLTAAAGSVRGTKAALTNVVGQATTFLNTTNTQVAGLTASLGTTSRDLGASKATVTKLATDLSASLVAAQKDMDQGAADYRDAVKSLGDVNLSDAVDSALLGLEIYMCLTYILFILTGAVLFVVSLRVPLDKLATK